MVALKKGVKENNKNTTYFLKLGLIKIVFFNAVQVMKQCYNKALCNYNFTLQIQTEKGNCSHHFKLFFKDIYFCKME